MRWPTRIFLTAASLGLLAARAPADDVKVVSRESMGRMPVEGTDDFRLVTNSDLSKVAVMDRWGEQHHWYVVMNSVVWEFYQEADAASAQFSADGKHLSLLAEHDGKWFFITDDKDVHPLGAGACRGLALAADGKHEACIQKIEDGEQVLLDGKPVAVAGVKMPLEEVAGVAFDTAGRLAFAGRAQGKAYVVLGEKLLGSVAADQVLAPVVSAEGKVLCGASHQDGTGTQVMRLVDGVVAGEPYRTPLAGTQVTLLTQSVNGEHLAWSESDINGNRVVVDGEDKASAAGNITQIVVGPNGKHWAWTNEDVKEGAVTLWTDGHKWEGWSVPAKGRLTLSEDGNTVHYGRGNGYHHFSLLKNEWVSNVAAADGTGVNVSIDFSTTRVNDSAAGEGTFLAARVGDSHTAYILTQQELPVQVNDKKLGEMTRTVVNVTPTADKPQPFGTPKITIP